LDSDSVSVPDLAPDSDLVQDSVPESVPESVSGWELVFGPAPALLTELSLALAPLAVPEPPPDCLLQFQWLPEFVFFVREPSSPA
jgi:hypothetical protein